MGIIIDATKLQWHIPLCRFVTTNLIPVIPAALVYAWYVFMIYREEKNRATVQQHQQNLDQMSDHIPDQMSDTQCNNNHDTSSNNSSADKKGSFLKVLGTWQICLLLFQPFYFSLVNALPITILGKYSLAVLVVCFASLFVLHVICTSV